jgi:outer membrane lipoprotein-sorting protein
MLHMRSILFHLAIFSGIAIAHAEAIRDSSAWRDAQRILPQLAKQHRAAKSFALKFEARAMGADGEPLPPSKGSLLVADSGRFRLEHAGGTVVCDGKALRQYTPSTKQVIIRDAADAGGADGILLRFLDARPVNASHLKKGLRVVLDPTATKENLDSLIVTLDPGNAIRSVETQDGAGNRVTYVVKSLRYGVHISTRDFTLQPPPGTETVDMR